MGHNHMNIRSFLLAGVVFPFAMGSSSFALETSKLAPAGWVLAQADEVECDNGDTAPTLDDCPPAEEAAPEEEAEPEAAEEAPVEEEPVEESPAEEVPEPEAESEEAPAAADQAAPVEAPEQQPTQAQEAAPADTAPAQEQPAAAEPAAPLDVLRRAQQQQEQLRQQQQGQTAQPAQEAAPVEAAPAQAVSPTEPTLQQPAAAEPADPLDVLRRAQQQQEQLRQQQQGQTGQPAQPAAPQQPDAAQAPAVPAAPSVVEQQLEAQGNEAEADQIRALREKLLQERAALEAAAPDAQNADNRVGGNSADNNQDLRGRSRGRGEGRGDIVQDRGDRIIIELGGNIFVEPVVPDEGERLLYGASDVEVEDLPGGRTRTIVYRENGSQIITIRDRRGEIIRRVRVKPNGREVVLIDNRYEDDYEELPPVIIFEERDLPPLVIDIPEEQYIVDLGQASRRQVQTALLAPPVQEINRQFTLEEVTRNERVRAYVPRIDLDTITFDFGSATISNNQMAALAQLGEAMEAVIAERPDEVYLIEGHTDAVGSDYDNLILSDRRAEAVAVALSQNFNIPPENLVTEGYGEQYLKVETQAPSRENRRVSVRRITELLSAENQQQ